MTTHMKKIFLTSLLLFVSFLALASRMPQGAKVYITPMQKGFENFITAEVMKQNVPLTVVIDEASADYVLTGSMAEDKDNPWIATAAGAVMGNLGNTPEKNQGALTLINKKEKSLVWAGNAGDGGFGFGPFVKKGQRKLAVRLVRQLNSDVFGNMAPIPVVSDISRGFKKIFE